MSSKNHFKLPITNTEDKLGPIPNGYKPVSIDITPRRPLEDIEIKEVFPGDFFNFGSSPKSEVTYLSDIKKELRQPFLNYLEEKRRDKIFVGDQWAFFKVGHKYHAYGANIVLKDSKKREQELDNLIEALKKESKGVWRKLSPILFILLLIGLLSVFAYKYTPVKKVIDQEAMRLTKPDSIAFLEKKFPIIKEWQHSDNAEKKEIALNIFDENKIKYLWEHVNSNNWSEGEGIRSTSDEIDDARARYILFDLMNHHPDIRNHCKNRNVIKKTDFEALCKIFVSNYTSAIFYWKTGEIEQLKDIEEIKKTFKEYHTPISEADYEYCFDNRLSVAELTKFTTVSLKVNKFDNQSLPSEWVAAVVENTGDHSGNQWESVILFKLGVSTSLRNHIAPLLKPEDDTVTTKKRLASWVSIPVNLVSDWRLDTKKLSREYNISESPKVYLKMFKPILNDNFLSQNRVTVKVQKAQEMLIKGSSTKPSCLDMDKSVLNHKSVSRNKNGTFGAGLSTSDPIKASIMHNILNSFTVEGLSHEASELHESNISILSDTGRGGEQQNIRLSENELQPIFSETSSFTIVGEGGSPNIEYFNIDKNKAVNPYAFVTDGVDIYVTKHLGDADREIKINGKHYRYRYIRGGGRIELINQ